MVDKERRGVWPITTQDDLILAHPLKVIQPQLLRHKDIANSLLTFVDSEGNANHDYGIGTQGFDSFAHCLLRRPKSSSSHLGECQKNSCAVDFAEITIDAVADWNGLRSLTSDLLKCLEYGSGFNLSNSDDQDIRLRFLTHSGFLCYSLSDGHKSGSRLRSESRT